MNCDEFGNAPPDERLAAGLRALAREYRGFEAPPRVESRLVAAFRGRAALTAPSRAWIAMPAWAAGIVLAAAGLFLISGSRPLADRMAVRPGMQSEIALASDAAAEIEAAYEDDDFIPLPNAAAIGPNEEIDVVRVEVPRSAMIALGFAVNAERASELVEADVMLGPGGVARAVRFLDE